MEHKVIDCSLKSILNVAIPMVLSSMSSNLMYAIDRFILAGYSINAVNAAVMASTFVMIFTFMFIGISDVAEIFVGQYNGSKQRDKLAAPSWQMIYLSVASSIIFLPIAYFSDYINAFPSSYLHDGVLYQKILMYFGMLPAFKAALSAFFIGQGKTKIITISVIIGFLTNVILDYTLIYGVENIIRPMGCLGAAVATIIAEVLQIAVLATTFFGENNRKTYGTLRNYRFDKKLFLNCVKIGAPMAFSNCVSLLAWFIVQTIVSHVSDTAATIYNVGIILYVFFIFVGEGINKAIATICANMIGSGDLQSIEKTRKIFVMMALLFGGVIAVPLILYPQCILHMLDTRSHCLLNLYSEIKIVLYLVAISVV
ncbi:MAG: polysaccharide biosynthesis C-terminal domain-containing protein, partial [Holosporales bacterium]|nr:polysaccharide biosynthesis C-terminal domain-containing protein [Holosporales bacterium]